MTQTIIDDPTVTVFYEDDHDRLDGLFKQFQQLKRTDFTKAKEFFKEFKFGLQRHIVWEEEILFPLFEQKTGTTGNGPTHAMRVEHRMIGEFLEEIHENVKVGNPNSDDTEEKLLNTLSAHNEKEEKILYPAIDQVLTDIEMKNVFTTMSSLPEERYRHCCTPAHNGKK